MRAEQVAVPGTVEGGVPAVVEEQAAVGPQPWRRRLREEQRLAELSLGDVGAHGLVRGEARHQDDGDLGAECLAKPLRLAQLDLEEAHAVQCLGDRLDPAPEPRRHPAGEHDEGDLPLPERSGSRRRRLVVARLTGRRQRRQVGRQWWLDRPGDDVRCCPERPVAKPGPQLLEGLSVEAVSLEGLPRGRVELVEDHRDLAGAGSESA